MASDIATLLFGLIALLVFFVVCVVIFLVMRQFMLWYWRVNETANNIAYIADYLRESSMDDNLAYLANLKRREQREKIETASLPNSGQPLARN